MKRMRACAVVGLGLTEGALGVRGLKKDLIEYELDWGIAMV